MCFLVVTPVTIVRLPVRAVAPEDTVIGGQGQTQGSAEAVVARARSHVTEEAAALAPSRVVQSHVIEEAVALTRNHTRNTSAANDPRAAVERKNTLNHSLDHMMTCTDRSMGERETLAGLSTPSRPPSKAVKHPKGLLTVSLQKHPYRIRAKTSINCFSEQPAPNGGRVCTASE